VDVLAALAPFLQAPLTIHGPARFSNRAFFLADGKKAFGGLYFLDRRGGIGYSKKSYF
jgi:hypothetical protein